MGDTFQSGGVCYCRNAESFRLNASQFQKLHTNFPKVWFAGTLPWLSQSRFEELFFFGVNKWSLVANVRADKALTEGSADWIVRPSRIDGRGNVLADMYLPGPRPQIMRIDVSEDANERQLWQTAGHEGGHGYGLMHFDPSPPAEWMEPRLNPAIDGPQAAEAKLMASVYGEPATKPSNPTPLLGDTICSIEVKCGADGKFYLTSEMRQGNKSATLTGNKSMAEKQPIYVAAHPAQQITISPPFIEQEEDGLADTELDTGELS